MRIAMVFDGLGYGGIERVGLTYAKMMLNLGHELTIYNLNPSQYELEGEFPDNCEIKHVSLPWLFLPNWFFPMTKRWWWGKFVYPIVYILSKTCLVFYALLYRIAHVKTNYDVAIAFAGHIRDLSFISYRFINSTKTAAWLHGSLADYLLSSYSFGDLYKKFDMLLTVSTAFQTNALEACSYLKDELDIRYIPNPVSESFEVDDKQVDLIRQEFGPFLVAVGRLDPDKDPVTVIKAKKVLKDKYGLNPNLVFVGDGASRGECEILARELDMEDSIYFVGAKPNPCDYLMASEIAIHSSPVEGFGMVLVEAMQCGTPIVSTKSQPGAPMILNDGEYGLMCEVRDKEEMAEKIYSLLTNEQLMTELSAKGKERAKDFTPGVVEKQLESLFHSLFAYDGQ